MKNLFWNAPSIRYLKRRVAVNKVLSTTLTLTLVFEMMILTTHYANGNTIFEPSGTFIAKDYLPLVSLPRWLDMLIPPMFFFLVLFAQSTDDTPNMVLFRALFLVGVTWICVVGFQPAPFNVLATWNGILLSSPLYAMELEPEREYTFGDWQRSVTFYGAVPGLAMGVIYGFIYGLAAFLVTILILLIGAGLKGEPTIFGKSGR